MCREINDFNTLQQNARLKITEKEVEELIGHKLKDKTIDWE